MSKKPIQIKGGANIPLTLQDIVEDINSGVLNPKTCTIVLDDEIYHLGDVDSRVAVTNAYWNLMFGAQRIMQKACSAFED